jgi:hypothetical protein
MARVASIAMQELRARNGRSAMVIEAVYLRTRGKRLNEVADGLGLTLAGLNARRKRAEDEFYGFVAARLD